MLTTVSTQIDQCMQRANVIIVITNSVEILQRQNVLIPIVMLIAVKGAWHVTNNGRTTDSRSRKPKGMGSDGKFEITGNCYPFWSLVF